MQVQDILSKHGMLINEKFIGGHVGTNFANNLMIQTYDGEDWIGDPSNSYAGALHKAELCFRDIDAPTVAFMVEFDDDESSRKAKEEIRELFGVGNHSVHINDTFEETMRLARCSSTRTINLLLLWFDRELRELQFLLSEYRQGIGEGARICVTVIQCCLSSESERSWSRLPTREDGDVEFDNL